MLKLFTLNVKKEKKKKYKMHVYHKNFPTIYLIKTLTDGKILILTHGKILIDCWLIILTNK